MLPWNWIYGNGNENSGFLAIQLDIVGFLAVLGEAAVLATAEVAALSKTSYLPRLMPAPQCLIRPFRPKVLHEYKGFTTSVWAGNHRRHINHVGHVLVDGEKYPKFSIRCVEIRRKNNPTQHRSDKKEVTDTLTAKQYGPLTWVAVTGFLFSAIILGLAVWKDDGAALVADIILSFLSSLVGLANKWKLQLVQRGKNKTLHTPPGDVVIRYMKGSFLIIDCEEDVARELYFAPEELQYLVKKSWQYRIIALVGTAMLMLGVIFLANAKAELQIAYAGAYIIMNALYWIAAALPLKTHWNTSCFEIRERCIQLPNQQRPQPYKKSSPAFVDMNETMTQVLWKAILVTKTTRWIRLNEAAPLGPAWDTWLEKAEAMARTASSEEITIDNYKEPIIMYHLPDWNPQKALGECLREFVPADDWTKIKPPKPPINLKLEEATAEAEKQV